MVPVVKQVVVTGTMTGTTLTYTTRCIVPESPWKEELFLHDEDEDEDDEESLPYTIAAFPALGVCPDAFLHLPFFPPRFSKSTDAALTRPNRAIADNNPRRMVKTR